MSEQQCHVRHIPDICLTYDTIRIPDDGCADAAATDGRRGADAAATDGRRHQ